MSKVPDIKRISKEDFEPQYYNLIEKLSFPINSFMEQVRNILNKGIDFDNLSRELITLSFQTNSSGSPISALSFRSSLRSRVRGINVVSTVITSSILTYQQNIPFITFSQNNNLVTILNISNLNPETKYEIVLETIS